MKNKFCREFLSLTFLTLLFIHLPAQQKALKIGDAIPEELWQKSFSIINGSEKTITLAKDRTKLILLDFWATWCASCLKNFPKMQTLEKEFAGKVKIIPVTKENRAIMDQFFRSKNGQRFKSMQSIFEDELLAKSFPHVGIPFMVWIKDGKLINTTDAEQVTAGNISSLLKGETASLQTVLQVDRSRPLMLAAQYDLEKSTSLLSYSLLSKGRIRAIAPGSGFHRTGTVINGRQLTNMPLLTMYRAVAYELFHEQNIVFSEKRLITLVKDLSKIMIAKSDAPEDAGKKLYSFDLMVPLPEANTLYAQMLNTLNWYSGYQGTLEKERLKCLIITKGELTSKGRKPEAQTNSSGQSLDNILADLNELPNDIPLILDESGFQGQIYLEPTEPITLTNLKNALVKAGLKVGEAEREVLVFVLKDQPANTENKN